MIRNTSKHQIFAGLTTAAVVLSLVVGFALPASAQTTTTTTSTGATFTRDLTIGSTGADVSALQSLLISKGFLQISAPTGYFGTLTQTALGQWQASVGISPDAGYFGPITRAYLASNMTTTTTTTSSVPGCAAGAMYSSTTGAPCTSTSSVPGCAAGALYSSTTGAPCTGMTTLPPGCASAMGFSATTGVACTPTTVTGNGVLTVTQDPAVVTNSNITNYTSIPLYGVQLQSQLGSATVSQLTLSVTDLVNGSSNENPGAFISSLSIVDPSTNTVIYTQPVSPATFIVNPNISTQFYVQLSGFNYVVPANTTKDLVVEANVSGSIYNQRQITVTGYPSGGNSIQYFTGANNIVNYQSTPWSVVSTFSASNNTSVIFGIDPSNPAAGSQYVNSTSGAQGVTLLAFNVQSSNGPVSMTNLTGIITATSSPTVILPTAAYLYNGSTLVSSVSIPASTGGAASSTAIAFNNFTDQIPSGTTKVFTIRADFPSNTATGTLAIASLNTITYSTSGGAITTSPNQNLLGNTQTFYSASSNLKITSTPTVTSQTNTNTASTTSITGSFPITITPQPGQEGQPVSGDFKIYVSSSTSITANSVAVAAGNVALSPFSPSLQNTTTPLSQGTTYSFTLTATEPVSSLATSGYYYFILSQASTTVANINGSAVQQFYYSTTTPNSASNQSPYVQK